MRMHIYCFRSVVHFFDTIFSANCVSVVNTYMYMYINKYIFTAMETKFIDSLINLFMLVLKRSFVYPHPMRFDERHM